MPQALRYTETPITRAEVDAIDEPLVLDFGTNWCGHCRAAETMVAEVLSRHPAVRHVRVEDGPGRRLGRSFAVRLWPTLIVLNKGSERARLVRPASAAELEEALASIEADA